RKCMICMPENTQDRRRCRLCTVKKCTICTTGNLQNMRSAQYAPVQAMHTQNARYAHPKYADYAQHTICTIKMRDMHS
ncbi:unnamed protein product, partial [Mycena citricolor]